MRHLLTALCLAIACSPALAADTPKKEPSEAQKAQQQRMKDCSAKSKGMKGKEHQDFMSSCLAGHETHAPVAKADEKKAKADEKNQTAQTEKKAPTQQEKMTACNKEASAKALKGKERDTFMSSCLKG